MELNPNERAWVDAKWAKIRSSQRQADEASNAWSDLSKRLKAKIEADQDRRRRSGRILMTDLEIAEIKAVNQELNDALATHGWHANEANRHAIDLQLYLKMKELGIK